VKGFHDSALHVLADLRPESGVSLLAQDPFFEYAFDELEQDNRAEFKDVKHALDKQKSRSTAVHRGQKRKANFKAKSVAKAKAAQAAAAKAAPVAKAAAAKAAPVAGHPPPAKAAPAAAAIAAPVAVAKALPKALAVAPLVPVHNYGPHYLYIVYVGGHIVFSDFLGKINAHCNHADHRTPKCHMDLAGFSWMVW
jgi:hypothetical protein